MKKLALGLSLLLGASSAGAQFNTVHILKSQLPACVGGAHAGKGFIVRDAIAADDCTVGGASIDDAIESMCLCTWDGYVAVMGAGGGGGGIGGDTGAIDNALLLADGTGGETLQGSPNIFQDASNNLVIGDSTGARSIWFSVVGTAPTIRRNGANLRVIGNEGNEVATMSGWFEQQDPSAISTFGSVTLMNSKTIAFSDGVDFNRFISKGDQNAVRFTDALQVTPIATAPTCDADALGMIYADTSKALCFCDATTWQVLNPLTVGVGTCA